jgi:hypothetical protein
MSSLPVYEELALSVDSELKDCVVSSTNSQKPSDQERDAAAARNDGQQEAQNRNSRRERT